MKTLFNIAHMNQMTWINCQWVVWSGVVAKLPRHDWHMSFYLCIAFSSSVQAVSHGRKEVRMRYGAIENHQISQEEFSSEPREAFTFHKRVLFFVIMQLYDGRNIICFVFSLVGFKRTFHWKTLLFYPISSPGDWSNTDRGGNEVVDL